MRDVDPLRWKTLGIIADPPSYSDGAFNTSLCAPLPLEELVYEVKRQRQGIAMRDVVKYILKIKGSSPFTVREINDKIIE